MTQHKKEQMADIWTSADFLVLSDSLDICGLWMVKKAIVVLER
jgi:hypothetical protein